MERLKKGWVLLVSLLVLSAPVSAGQSGAKAGLLLPGGMTVDNGRARDFDANAGLMLGVFSDFQLGDKVSAGPFLDFSQFTVADGSGVSKIDVGASLKFRVRATPQVVVRPFVNLAYGYASITTDNLTGFVTEASNSFLVYALGVEAVYERYVFDVGYTGASGGNEEFVYFWGQTYLRVGYLFD